MDNKDQSRQAMKKVKKGIRKKLYAATSMLLVCAILLTTATYAWLSLSVSPSVEKISTTVTGNGSLEIALATSDIIENLDLISDFEALTGYDDEGNYDSSANSNWGNLVDLSDEKYGFSRLKMYPALLNITGDKVGDNPLKIANFGADGRVTYLNADTTSAMYDKNTASFLLNGKTDYGVRALGVSTSTGLWDALETALRATKKDGDSLLKEKMQVTLSGINMEATIAQYIEYMSIGTASVKPTVKSLINIAEKILGTEAVEATETTEAVEGTDGIIDKLDVAVRNLILAGSGYSDKYVSVTADEMLEIAEGEMSTVEIIEKYVLEGTDLANLCNHYVVAANSAEKLQEYYEVLQTKNPNETGTHDDLKTFAAPIFGNSFKVYYTAWINRTAKVEKTVTVEENGQSVEKTVTETVVTHEGDIISANSLNELDAMITALGQPAEGEKEVVSCTASNKTKNIEVLDTDNMLSAMAQIAGAIGNNSTSIDTAANFIGKPTYVLFPCHTEKCAIDQLSSVEREFAYQENLFTLQTMWNQLDVQRNALAAAIDGEMLALGDITKAAVFYEDYCDAFDEFDLIVKADPENYKHNMVKMNNYDAPDSASHETLQKHVDTMQDALDFYYDFTVQAALTYASKDTTNLDVYISLTDLLATEEDERSIPLEDIIAAVGTGFTEQYADAISGYNAAQQAVKNAQEKINIYNIRVEEELEEAEANGTTPPLHPTWQEDLELRSAFTDTNAFIDYINEVDIDEGFRFEYRSYDSIIYDFITLGIGRSANYYSYINTVGEGENAVEVKKYSLNSSPIVTNGNYENSALFEAWLEMLGRKTDNAVDKFNSLVQPFVYVYEEDYSGNMQLTVDDGLVTIVDAVQYIPYEYRFREGYDADELFAMGYSKEIDYDIQDVRNIRQAYDELNTVYLTKAYNFIKGTVEYYLTETGLVNDDGITVTDTQGNVVTATSVKTLLKGIIDTTFADATTPMADRLEAELKTAIGTVPYAEFRQYADELLASISTDNAVWAYIMRAAEDYDAILSQLAEWDKSIKELESKELFHKFTWDEISYSAQVITGVTSGYKGSTYDYGYFNLYLSDKNVFEDFVTLYSDKFEYENYNRGGTWRYAPYNVEQGPLPELKLGLIRIRYSEYDDNTTESLYKKGTRYYENGSSYTYWSNYERRGIGSYHSFFLRSPGNFNPANGITPLYNLAVNNTKSVQTDRSIMFRQLVKDMKLAKTTAEDSKGMIALWNLGDYVTKTMFVDSADYPVVNSNLASITVDENTIANHMYSVPESYSYDDVEFIIALLDDVEAAMDSYKASLRTSFMLWSASANGTKDAYKAVAANYTGTIDDMMAAANLKAGNVYYDAYSNVQYVLDKAQQSRELLVTILAGKPETVTETDVVPAAMLKQALVPLAEDMVWYGRGVDGNEYNGTTLELTARKSVLGTIYSLYDSSDIYWGYDYDENGIVFNFNDGYGVLRTARYLTQDSNMMQRAINTAIEGGVTFDANVSANSTASAILSDSYAFAIDLLLRTNADNSNLLLQTEEKQRIYDEEFGAVETMGSGSVLTYTLDKMAPEQLEKINSCVRVVFTDTTTGKILACAKPDELVIPEPSYADIYGDTIPDDETEDDTIEMAGYLHLCEYEITESGILYVGDTLEDAAIMPLDKNKTTPITVYVYLDGNEMNNSTASGLQDISFDMNLQFASDAELVPANAELNVS